jgi:hypothetical protein
MDFYNIATQWFRNDDKAASVGFLPISRPWPWLVGLTAIEQGDCSDSGSGSEGV